MKDVSTDVDMLKEMFREEIGSTWREATHRNSVSHLGMRGEGPWIELAKSGRAEHTPTGLFNWVEEKVRHQARWQRWDD